MNARLEDVVAGEWQPISTAPKTLDYVLVLCQNENRPVCHLAHWAEGGGEEQPRFGPAWFRWDGYQYREIDPKPTHWMKFPDFRASLSLASESEGKVTDRKCNRGDPHPPDCQCGDDGSPDQPSPAPDAVGMARMFHDTYERLAPQFGYETRPETREFNPESPNGRLMIAVCDALAAYKDSTQCGKESATGSLKSCSSSEAAEPSSSSLPAPLNADTTGELVEAQDAALFDEWFKTFEGSRHPPKAQMAASFYAGMRRMRSILANHTRRPTT